MKGILFATALLVVTSAAAVEAPPQRYEWAPLLAPVFLRDIPPADIKRLCGRFAGEGDRLDACAVLDGGFCYVFIRNDGIHEDFYAALVRHEMAHCRGWPADHPK